MSSDSGKQNKAGPWSKEDKQFIADNCEKMPVEEIAARLQRNSTAVKNFIYNSLGKKITVASTDHLVDEYSIRTSPLWAELKKQLDKDELELFVGHWTQIISQFREDVLPTEQIQIVDMIKLDIMMGRVLQAQLATRNKIKELKESIDIENDNEQPDKLRVEMLERQIAILQGSNVESTKEFSELLNRKANMMKDLKATRAERVKNFENSKQSLSGWVSELIRNPALRKELGINMEKFRIAIDLEEVRLSNFHKYMDGQTDIPVYNAEVLDKLEKEENNDSDSNRS